MIIVAPFFVRKGFNGITLWPFIILRSHELKSQETLLNHEKIHLRQQLELLILFFYLWYLIEYCYYLIRYKNQTSAYYAIRFEKEAYQNQHQLDYLQKRKFWAFLSY